MRHSQRKSGFSLYEGPELPSAVSRRYRVLEKIASGEMSEVFKATRIASNTTVALKVLKSYAGESYLARARQEARLGAGIQHRNLCEILDFQEDADGRACIVMPFLKGITLADLLKHGPVSPMRARNIAMQILSALSALHREKIIHRDVTPKNVFIVRENDDDLVKLLDLGISKDLQEEERIVTRKGIMLGTMQYVAPERISFDTHVDSPRADIYAVGVVLYEMVTGRKPFRRSDLGSIIKGIAASMSVLPPRSIDSWIPHGLEEIIMVAMSRDPGDRFGSATKMRLALESLSSDEDLYGSSPSSRTRTFTNKSLAFLRQPRRARGRLWDLTLVFLVIAFLGVGIFLGLRLFDEKSVSANRRHGVSSKDVAAIGEPEEKPTGAKR